ncbi:MAG TPA: hypothetical protein PLG97_01890 [Alcaligenes sp.]|nr:hypothetical protein [Alcaligenes sp.]HRL26246.1 hypothetical protein [Alcaligenes sp.]
MLMSQPASSEEIAALLKDISPLPVQGRSWPRWVAATAWLVLVLIGIRMALVASSPQGAAISPLLAGSLVLLFTGLIVIAWYMWHGVTTIDQDGIRQSWIMKRQVQWQDIHFAKFVPLFNSKRLICFTRRGRPIVFQGAAPELQVAFAKISLVLRRKT